MAALLVFRGLTIPALSMSVLLVVLVAVVIVAFTYGAVSTPALGGLGKAPVVLPVGLIGLLGVGVYVTDADPWFAAAGSVGVFAALALNGRTGAPLLAAAGASVSCAIALSLQSAPTTHLLGSIAAVMTLGTSAEVVARVRKSAWLLDRRQRRQIGDMGNLLRSADVLAALRHSDAAATTMAELACDLIAGEGAAAILPDIVGSWELADTLNWPDAESPLSQRALVGIARRMADASPPMFFSRRDMDSALKDSGLEAILAVPLPGEAALRGVVIVAWWEHCPDFDDLMLETASRFSRQAGRALERMRHLQRIADDALKDPLTRVANRRALDAVLQHLQAGDAVAILDLDHFKEVNDTDGHAEGDKVLQQFAGFLRRSTRVQDTVGRWGGEEFLVIFPGALDQAMPLLERLRADWEADEPRTTFSGGLAMMSPNVRPAQVLEEADMALYQAKAAGRNRVYSDVDSTMPPPAASAAYAASEVDNIDPYAKNQTEKQVRDAQPS